MEAVSEEDGGPVFSRSTGEEGMSLRDHIAITANRYDIGFPTDLARCAAFIGVAEKEYDYLVHWPQVLAKARYIYADAMLAERAKR